MALRMRCDQSAPAPGAADDDTSDPGVNKARQQTDASPPEFCVFLTCVFFSDFAIPHSPCFCPRPPFLSVLCAPEKAGQDYPNSDSAALIHSFIHSRLPPRTNGRGPRRPTTNWNRKDGATPPNNAGSCRHSAVAALNSPQSATVPAISEITGRATNDGATTTG